MELSVGDKVVYPCHGVAEVTAIADRTFGGERATYVVFAIPERADGRQRPMVISIPADRAEAVGVRQVASPEDAEDVLALLAVTDVRMPSNWSRRFKNHQEKLKTGDLFQYAEVVRNLSIRLRATTLAAAESAMYASARYLVSSELAATWSISAAAADARMDQALGLVPAVAAGDA